MQMNRKRLEHLAGILRDLGLAATIGGAGDVVVNPASGRTAVDAWGVASGLALLLISVIAIGIDLRQRGT